MLIRPAILSNPIFCSILLRSVSLFFGGVAKDADIGCAMRMKGKILCLAHSPEN